MSTKHISTKMNENGYVNPYLNYDENGKLISLDSEGNVISRTESDYPYSFSEHCIWAIMGKKRTAIDKMNTRDGVYSDRLQQQDALKFEMACRSVWGNQGQRFDSRFPKDIEKMLQIVYDNPKLKLYRTVKSCNASTGYPVWYFGFYTEA